jgi:hypothetical protein
MYQPLSKTTPPGQERHPCVLEHFSRFLELVDCKRVAVFLDYDGVMFALARGGGAQHNLSILPAPPLPLAPRPVARKPP